jgi:hypothetical protein
MLYETDYTALNFDWEEGPSLNIQFTDFIYINHKVLKITEIDRIKASFVGAGIFYPLPFLFTLILPKPLGLF